MTVYRQKRELMKMFHCNEQKATSILDFAKNKVYAQDCVKFIKDCKSYQLVDSKKIGIYFLFTDIAEKELKTDNFKILNSDDFSKVELQWLEDNYKFRCKTKFK